MQSENLVDSFTAIRGGDVDALQTVLLREHPASVTDIDHAGRTMLHVACSSSTKQEVDVVRFLLEQGSGVNVQDKRGNTPLHNAARISGKESVKLLLTFGCDATIRNSDGQTPLSLASAKARGAVTHVLKTHVQELMSIPKTPNPPFLVRATSSSLEVLWKAPESSGSMEPPLSTYDLRYSLRGLFQPWTTQESLTSCGPLVIGNLRPGTDYVLSIRATNRNGSGGWSSKSLTMTTRTDGQDPLEFQQSSSPGGGGRGVAAGMAGAGTGSSTALPPPSPPPPIRSNSLETLLSQRNKAEERCVELQRHRTYAERAMLDIEREREAATKSLKVAQTTTRDLRKELRVRNAAIATMREEQREQRELMKESMKESMPADAASCSLSLGGVGGTRVAVGSGSLLGGGEAAAAAVAAADHQAKSRVNELESEVRRLERRCQAAEVMVEAYQLESSSSKEGRSVAESALDRMEIECAAMRKQILEERRLRESAEEIASKISSLVDQLQRRTDAAEMLAEELELERSSSGGGGGGGGGGEDGKDGDSGGGGSKMLRGGSGKTVAQLQEALSVSNRRLFELAGAESSLSDVEKESKSLAESLLEVEEQLVRSEMEAKRLMGERDSMREQRDEIEKMVRIYCCLYYSNCILLLF